MSTELVEASAASVPATGGKPVLPELVERAGGAARFAWEEYFYAEHHNPHTQRAYLRAVKAFLGWAEGQGVELPSITPGMVGQYLVGLGGRPRSGISTWRRYAASSTGSSTGTSASSTRRRPCGASRMK